MIFNLSTSTASKSGAALGLALTLGMGLGACNKNPDGQMSDSAAATAPMESADMGVAMNDAGITAQVKTRLASDARTQGADISVETNNGVVTLSGVVNDADTQSAAEELARHVPEVTGVNNQITAPNAMDEMAAGAEQAADKAGTVIDDSWITTKVKTELLADARTKGTQISVDTQQGIVTLSGTVASNAERERAVEIAQSTEGVSRVESSTLTVKK